MQLRRILNAGTLFCGVVATLATSTSALAAENANRELTADERKAIQVVEEFVHSMHTKPCKAGSLFADDLIWRAGRNEPLKTGKESALKLLKSFTDPTSPFSEEYKLAELTIFATTAIGGTGDVLVTQSRRDVFFDKDGKPKRTGAMVGGFFRVNPTTWKIQEWLDTPLNIFVYPANPKPLPAVIPGEELCPPGAP